MNEELQVLGLVAGRLDAAGIAYMLTGSMALNYYGRPRMTRDIDMVIAADVAGAGRLCDLFASDFYVDREAAATAIRERGMFNLIHLALVVKVDLIVRKDSEYRRIEFDRRRRAVVESLPLFVVAPEDLIISKLDWARDTRSERQLGDVRSLLASGVEMDRGYLVEWVRRLGLEDLYREVTP